MDALGDPVGTVSVRPPCSRRRRRAQHRPRPRERRTERALRHQIAKLHSEHLPADSGAAVVIDPQNGAVLAMASYPTYDPSWWVGGMSTAHYCGPHPAVARATRSSTGPSRASTNPARRSSSPRPRPPSTAGLITPTSLISDPGYFTIPDCSGGLCTFHNNESESCGVVQRDDRPHDLRRRLLLHARLLLLGRPEPLWGDPDPEGGRRLRPRPADRRRPAGRVRRPGGQPVAAQGAACGCARKRSPTPTTGLATTSRWPSAKARPSSRPLQLADAYATFANGGTRYAPEVAAGHRLSEREVDRDREAEGRGTRPSSREHLPGDLRRAEGRHRRAPAARHTAPSTASTPTPSFRSPARPGPPRRARMPTSSRRRSSSPSGRRPATSTPPATAPPS